MHELLLGRLGPRGTGGARRAQRTLPSSPAAPPRPPGPAAATPRCLAGGASDVALFCDAANSLQSARATNSIGDTEEHDPAQHTYVGRVFRDS
jgi:hypothetical protein